MKDLDSFRLMKRGNIPQEMCLQKNLSQKKLAFLIDAEISQITRIERGIINTSILNLKRIADALEISSCEFFKNIDAKD